MRNCRFNWFFLLFIILAFFLSAGIIYAEGQKEEAEVKEIDFWHSYTQESRSKAMSAIAGRFENEKGIKVNLEIVPWPNLPQKLRASYSSDSLPDAGIILIREAMEMYELGALVPSDDILTDMGGKQAFFDGYVDKNLVYDGHVMGIPHYAHARMLYYRDDWIKEAGLSVPHTLDEILNVAETLNDPPNRYGFVLQFAKNDWAAALYLDIFMQATGGEFFDEQGNVNFNTPEVKEAVQFMVDLYHAASIPGELNLRMHAEQDLIASGTSALMIGGPGLTARVIKDAPELLPVVKTTEPPGWVQGSILVGLYEGSKKEAAEDWIKFMFEKDNYIQFLHSFQPLMFPLLKDIADSDEFMSGEWIQKRSGDVDTVLKGIAEGHEIGMQHGLNPLGGIVTTGIIEEMFHSILADDVSVDQAVADTHDKMEELAEEWSRTLGLD